MSKYVVCLIVCLSLSTQLWAEQIPPYTVDIQGEGAPVYFIPGLASPGEVWDELAGELRELGFQSRVLTLAGFAGVAPMNGKAFLPLVHEQLAAELAGLDQPAIVIGHSLGAFLALWLATTSSEHLAGIVAVDGVPFLGGLADASATPESNRANAEQMASFMASLSVEQYAAQNRMALSGMISDPAAVERFAETSGRSDPATVGRAVAEMLTIDLRPELHRIGVPVVLIQAADSGAMDSMRESYAAQVASIADLRHVVATRGRHFVQVDDPEFVLAEVKALLERLNLD
ncbi:MAG: alpha/beta hydrolase [Wenzhouxiangella sp.]|nr:alpha/beta hydrolase [Wenzhouxiangella sp.]